MTLPLLSGLNKCSKRLLTGFEIACRFQAATSEPDVGEEEDRSGHCQSGGGQGPCWAKCGEGAGTVIPDIFGNCGTGNMTLRWALSACQRAT